MARDDKTTFLNASNTPYSTPLPGYDEDRERRTLDVGQSPQPQDMRHKIPGEFAREGRVVVEKVPKTRMYDKMDESDGTISPWRPKGGAE